jgi:hypothetical protein
MSVVQVPLGKGRFAEVDAAFWESVLTCEFTDGRIYSGRICDSPWHALVNKNNTYAQSTRKVGTVYMHRLIAGATALQVVDHRDGNGLNNRRENLRIATIAQNQWNSGSHKDCRCGFKGVAESKSRFTARIRAGRTGIYIGSFATAEEAARAYDEKAIELFGEFARLNFPRELVR